MVATSLSEHTLLGSGHTQVVVQYEADGHARLEVTTDRDGRGPAEAGRLVCEAVHQARLRHASRVEGGLDASGPACGAILEALHRRLDNDLRSIAMRRAGSSVMVVLELRPMPATARTATTERAGVVPAQPSGSSLPAAVGAEG